MNREMVNSGIPWIGEIPVSWSVMPHKRVMHKVKEIQEHYNGEDIISLTMRGVIVRDLEAGGKMPTSFDGYQKVYPNNLLQCLFDIDVTPRCVGLIKNEGLTSPAYSQFEMHSNAYAPYYDYLLRYMDDGKTLLHLSKNLRSSLTETDFGTIPTCVPPISVQQKIASFLDSKCAEIDEMIALQEKIVEELKAYKQSVITEAVTKGLNPDAPMKDSGIEWIGKIPEHWEVKKLKFSCKLFGRIGFRGYTADDLGDESEGAITLSPTNMDGIKLDFTKCSYLSWNKYYESPEIMVEVGDVLLVKTASVGKCSYVDSLPKETTVNPQILVLKEHKDYSKFIAYLFQTPIGEAYINTTKGGSTIYTISQEKIGNYEFAFPSPNEQQAIADYLDKKCGEIDELIAIKQSKIDSLKEYKKSIIYEYVTGKKEVI